MIKVKALTAAVGPKIDGVAQWATNEVGYARDADAYFFTEHSDAFTILPFSVAESDPLTPRWQAVTANKTLVAADAGKIFVITGNDITITLPAAASLPSGWIVTLHNDNSSNSPTAHSAASANTPYGRNVVRIMRQGSDTVMGNATPLHGATMLIGARASMDIWVASASTFGARGSERVGWKDLTLEPRTFGANAKDPTESQVDAAFMRKLEFTNATSGNEKEVYGTFHIQHDYMMGTRVYPHVHWMSGNTAATDALRWGFQAAAAKRLQAFSTTGTTVYATTALSGTPYMHYVSEVSDADAFPATDLEPDSLIEVRVFRDSANAADTYAGSVWMNTIDLHYLADRHATPGKASPFYL